LKGNDQALVRTSKTTEEGEEVWDYDEPRHDMKVNYFTAIEAYTKMLGFPQVQMSHTVISLAINDPDKRVITFMEGAEDALMERAEAEGVENLAGTKRTQFEQYMDLCAAGKYDGKYEDMVERFTWNTSTKKWKKRAHGRINTEILSRIFSFNPSNPKMYAIRLIVLHRGNIKSWEDLRTHEGTEYATYEAVIIKSR
jgi:hypothetical protein